MPPSPAPQRLLILFSCINLVVGSAAFVITGILDAVARGLGTSVAAAGQAMTAYAVATAVLAPLLLMATGGWSRRGALLAALALFTAGNLLCALSESLATLLVGRVLMGTGAMVTPVMSALAVSLVEPARRGRALAFVFLGVSLSYVVGLPLGAWLGLSWGWHAPLWAGTAIAALAFAAAWRWVPAGLQAPGASFAGLAGLLTRPPVLAALVLTLLYFTAIFSVFSYIGPVLRALVPMDGTGLSLTLAAFGLSGVAGTLVGGRASDRFGPGRTLAVLLGVLLAMMLLLPLTAGSLPALMTVLLVWGVAGFGMMAPQQGRLALMAGAQTPLALSVNASMLYLGTALGAAVGGAASGALGFDRLAWVGAPFAATGLLVLLVSGLRGVPAREAPAARP